MRGGAVAGTGGCAGNDWPYHILVRLGVGGLGEVCFAEQREPIRRKVALNWIRSGMDQAERIARFEPERQALALMDHPGVARVLDAGATEDDRPYFAIEYVMGESITRDCDRARLTVVERAELMVLVSDAAQHATNARSFTAPCEQRS